MFHGFNDDMGCFRLLVSLPQPLAVLRSPTDTAPELLLSGEFELQFVNLPSIFPFECHSRLMIHGGRRVVDLCLTNCVLFN